MLTLDAGDTIQGTPLAYYYAKVDPITGERQAPDGRRDERRSATTPPRSATTSSTTASTRCAPSSAARLPAARRERASTPATGGRPSRRTSSRQFSPAHGRDRQGRHPRPDQPRHRDLGQGQRRGQDGVPRAGRAGEEVRARAASDGLRRGRRRRPLGRRHVLVVRRRAALPGERRHAGRRSRCPASTRSWSATPTTRSRSASSTQRRRPASRCCSREPLLLGHAAWPSWTSSLEATQARPAGGCRRATARRLLNSNTVAEDPKVAARRCRTSTTRSSTTSTPSIGTSTQAMSGRAGRRRGRADHRLRQLRAGRRGQGRPGRRRRGAAGAVDRGAVQPGSASFPPGDVTVRDVAGLYIYDNTLLGVKVTGAQVRDYLEYSAQYFKPVTDRRPVHRWPR